jgi:hypothetical protein
MKKLLASLLLALPLVSQAAVIYTDETLFLSKYENPTHSIDFATAVPSRLPVESNGNRDTLHSDSFSDDVFFETRQIGNLTWSWTAVDRLKTGGPIFATDLQNIQEERIGIWTSHLTILALHTNLGFFGWVPELGGLELADTLLLLPLGAEVQSVQWGFTPKPVEAPEPSPLALILCGILVILAKSKPLKRQSEKS